MKRNENWGMVLLRAVKLIFIWKFVRREMSQFLRFLLFRFWNPLYDGVKPGLKIEKDRTEFFRISFC